MSYPSTIQAITIAQTGDYDVIEKTSVPFPDVAPDHVVVKVEYFGVNFIDTYLRSGLYKFPSFPAVLGKEVSGTIVGLPTDQKVLDDENYKNRGFAKGGKVAAFSTFAEYVSVPWKSVIPVPDSVPTSITAAGLIQGLTALTFATEAYDIKKGDSILVHTAAGGLGLILTQIAKSKGAMVIGTTSTKEKAELAKANGADHVILYTSEDTVKRVLEITNGEGVHGIFDGVGKDTFDKNFEIIRRKGTIVSLGNASGAVPPFAPLKLSEKNVKICRPTLFGYIATPTELWDYGHELYDLVAKGSLKLRIFKEYPFTAEGVQQSQRDLVGGRTTGKLVIKVSDV